MPNGLDRPVTDDDFALTHSWYSDEGRCKYKVVPGEIYEVFAVLYVSGAVYYLIDNTDMVPGFFPCLLFTLDSGDIRGDWKIFEYNSAGTVSAALGPKALIGEFSDIPGILNEKETYMRKFLDYKEYLKLWNETP